MPSTLKEVIETYWRAANDRDWETFASLLHDDIIYEVPQTRERIRGRSAFTEFNAKFPGDWTLRMERVVAEESHAVSQIVFLLDRTEQSAVSFFDFKDGLISRIVEFWPEPYDPPRRMSDGIERY